MKYYEHFEVLSTDVDMNNNMRPSLYFRYLQETANHQMRDRRPTYDELFAQGVALIVTRMQLEIYQPVHQYDEIETSTWRVGEHRATYRRCYAMTRGGELCAAAYSEWGAVSIGEDRGVLPTSAADLSALEQDEEFALDLPKRFRFPKDAAFEPAGAHHVTYEDVDVNSHMNNTRYPDILWSRIPDIADYAVTSLNIRFMREGILGSDLEISRTELDPAFSKDPRAERAVGLLSKRGDATNVEAVFGLRRTERAHEVRVRKR